MSDTPKPLDLEAIESEMAGANQGVRCPAEQFIERRGPALVAEVKRLREALKNIQGIEEYVGGRVCTCSGVGCVECIARLTLEGREKELFS